MPWRGFEPRRLSAPPPQDGVSTSFTTRALNCCECVGSYVGKRRHEPTRDPTHQLTASTGPTGLEPATSRVTVECSNQTELRPQLLESGSKTPSSIRLLFLPDWLSISPHFQPIAPRGIEPLSAP